MKVTGGLVSAGSGSYGRSTWSHNRFGPYIRTRSVPVNANTSFQQAIRNVFGQLATYWTDQLAQLDRDAWETFAANVAVVDKIGNQIHLTGQEWFIKANAPRLQAGKIQINPGPTLFALAALSAVTVTASAAADTLSVAFVNTDDWATTINGHLFVYASRPVSPSINYFNGPYRLVGTINGAGTPPTSPAVMTSPFAIEADQKQFYRFVASNDDGRPSVEYRTSDIVGA